ncbi:hypothetical protein HI855_05125 [Cyanobacteria bacterium 150NLHA]|uniref:hypothetical protein n=1 Tax=Prochlorococcus sp. P1361 TaxID=2729589 RepID=UPI0007B3D4F3|nr:hypothetical protein [Prochlorococcus sp. P1361]NMO84540.1 hypothetical protein [Prochlorococcus sp. P1344]NMP05954.1 hypothetical protein [Prochlorococcus sp. P1361]
MVNTKHQSHFDAIGERSQVEMDSAKPFQQLLLPDLGNTRFVANRLSHTVKRWNEAQVTLSMCKSLR